MADCDCQRCSYVAPILDRLDSRPPRVNPVRHWCVCGHTAEQHEMRKEDSGCDAIACLCLKFRYKETR